MELYVNKKESRDLLIILSNAYVINKNKRAKELLDNFKEQLGDIKCLKK